MATAETRVLAMSVEPIDGAQAREAAAKEVREMIAELERAGVTIYKIALMCHRQFNTIKGWKRTGRIEHYDWQRLAEIHAHYCKALTIPATPSPP